jgi:hypothetical protein
VERGFGLCVKTIQEYFECHDRTVGDVDTGSFQGVLGEGIELLYLLNAFSRRDDFKLL